MIRSLLVLFMVACAAFLRAEPAGTSAGSPVPAAPAATEVESGASASVPGHPELSAAPKKFYVLRIEGEIAPPALYVVRNGLKDAIVAGAEYVILDMNTPGGRSDVMFEIIEALENFEGRTITFVNREAMSAGALIAAGTHDIYFAPRSVIGAAAPVSSGGQDIDATMKDKIVSYITARMRAISEEHPYRGDVITAMIDREFELKVGDTVIRPKGGPLLSLTQSEAMKEYGDPARPLLGAGIADDIPSLVRAIAGGSAYEIREFTVTWSLRLAQWLTAISPLLLGIGGLMLAIEFKTPGFGWIGATGIALILVVFFGHNVAGLAGHEPMLVFLLGVGLVFVEILLLPGTIVFAAAGLLLMLGSLLWGMADIWPGGAFELSPGLFMKPAYTLSVGFLIALALFAAVMKFLPATPMWSRLSLGAEIREAANAGLAQERAGIDVGATGVVISPLRPTGTVEIAGRRFEARTEVGEVDIGAAIRVVRRGDFVLIVEKLET